MAGWLNSSCQFQFQMSEQLQIIFQYVTIQPLASWATHFLRGGDAFFQIRRILNFCSLQNTIPTDKYIKHHHIETTAHSQALHPSVDQTESTHRTEILDATDWCRAKCGVNPFSEFVSFHVFVETSLSSPRKSLVMLCNVVELEKCCKMHIWVQKSASIQLQTSSLKLAAQPAISCTCTSYLAPSGESERDGSLSTKFGDTRG